MTVTHVDRRAARLDRDRSAITLTFVCFWHKRDTNQETRNSDFIHRFRQPALKSGSAGNIHRFEYLLLPAVKEGASRKAVFGGSFSLLRCSGV